MLIRKPDQVLTIDDHNLFLFISIEQMFDAIIFFVLEFDVLKFEKFVFL